jgi:endonuclease/exonuclease/phosphatase family metal-dependent hydrolase
VNFCSYNIQYGLGKDGRFDLDRIVADIGDQDVICLQEVERYFPETGMVDQVAEIAVRFPGHHWVFGAGVDVDADFCDENGAVQHRRQQFGNMLLSRAPVLSSRNHLLPKHGLIGPMSLQRSAVEGVIETRSGPLRVYSTHLAHASAAERRDQITALLSIIRELPGAGGVWSGTHAPAHWTETGKAPPMPYRAVLMGDFNMTPLDNEYEILVGSADLAHGRLARLDGLLDAWVSSKGGPFERPTCVEAPRGDRPERSVRLDYMFVTPDLESSLISMSINDAAQGSDHQPIFAEMDL